MEFWYLFGLAWFYVMGALLACVPAAEITDHRGIAVSFIVLWPVMTPISMVCAWVQNPKEKLRDG